MSLQFIMGPSGSGKSHYLYQKVTEESLKNPNKNYIVLVPEQFTLQTQKDLVMASPRKGILNVDVLSFNRLAYRIFDEIGGEQRIVLDDVGKSLVIRKVAGDCEKELRMLGGNLKKTGFISEMKSIISEFTQYDIQGPTLEHLIEQAGENTNFYHKLKDIKTIYKAFQKYLQGQYITGEELLDVLCLMVPKSQLLKDSVIVLDGFTGFTPVQNQLLKELLLVSEKVMLTVTMDDNPKSGELFMLSEKMIRSLTEICQDSQIEVEAPICLYEKPVYRFRNNETASFLEENLFRYSRKKYDKEPKGLQIFHGKNPKEELDFVAQKIRHMVRCEGLRYREIAVITGDIGAYSTHVERCFEQYDIPFFMDHKRSILLNSFVEYIRSLLAMAEQNFTYESVFRYLRTDLTSFTKEEIDLLENYCLAFGIRGQKKWQEKWIQRTKQMEETDLEVVNLIRKRFIDELDAVMYVLKSRFKTVQDVTVALYEFFENNEIAKKVKVYEEMFGSQGELTLEKEYAQIYRIVMDLFDQFVELLGKEKISIKEYCELLDAGLSEAKVGIIPPSMEQVVIGDIERTRIKDMKVVFFVGVNDVYIPGNTGGNGLLTERDRERFEAQHVTLAPSAKEKMFIQKFYLYSILTKPSENIILTYSKTALDGKGLRPAYLIFELLKMFPHLVDRRIESTFHNQEWTVRSGIRYLIDGLQNKSEGLGNEWLELYSWYKANPTWTQRVEQMVEAAFYHKEHPALTKETAENLYGTLLQNSVTRLEKFSACAYAHFLSYGLKLKEREIYQFQAVDLGTLFHEAMERYSQKQKRAGYHWTDIEESMKDAWIQESIDESISHCDNMILYSSARNEYMITRLKRMMRRTVWALTKQLEYGNFVPADYEIVYDSGKIELQDGNEMRLFGKIDRVDVCETEDNVFVKIIDYKTGHKVFDLGELYHGLQMQLVLYLNATVEMEQKHNTNKKIIPAALFYYQMQDPMIAREDDENILQEKILKELRPNGVVNGSEEVIAHLDKNFSGQSLVIPVGRKKDGSFTKQSQILAGEAISLVEKYARHKTIAIANEIMSGKVEASPYEFDKRTSCDYCPYHNICGFDSKLSGYEYRKLQKLSTQEAITKMEGEV